MTRVADAMVTTPALHPSTTTIAQAREALQDPHRHLVLIVSGGRLLGTVTVDDLHSAAGLRSGNPALSVAGLVGRLVDPAADVEPVRLAMLTAGQRRRAVVDGEGRLLGLLCLKASGTGFCSDRGIAARSAEPAAAP